MPNGTIDLILARLNRLEILIYFCLVGSIPDILSVTGGDLVPKKNKQQQDMEKQIQSFAGTTAGSVLIALGIGVFAFPYAVSYVVKKTTEEGGRRWFIL